VLNGLYDAGGIQDTLARRLLTEGKIRILAESKPYPSSLICYNRSVQKDVVEAVRKALLGLDPQGKHKALLPGWDRTEMPAGFIAYNKRTFDEIDNLAQRYGLIK
jgi:phosphonate transport system substrate-binding protein